MCGRYTLRAPASAIVSQFGLRELFELVARHNIAPTQQVLAVRRAESAPAEQASHAAAGSAARQGVWLRWGLVPSWSKDAAGGQQLINARSETAAQKPSFRSAFRQRRCLIVADGFYEWKKAGGQKQPFFIHRRDDRPFAFAGLWEQWQQGESPLESCTILTTAANDLMRPLHERMPVILSAESCALWLDPETPPEVLQSLLEPGPTPDFELRPVSEYVNSPRHDDAGCVAAVTRDAMLSDAAAADATAVDGASADDALNDATAAKSKSAKPSSTSERQSYLF